MKSIVQDKKECYFCGRTEGLHRHHIFFGTSNRKNSEEHGCWIWLCAEHHTLGSQAVHKNHAMDLALKVIAQKRFEKEHSREEFRQIFGKSWV